MRQTVDQLSFMLSILHIAIWEKDVLRMLKDVTGSLIRGLDAGCHLLNILMNFNYYNKACIIK